MTRTSIHRITVALMTGLIGAGANAAEGLDRAEKGFSFFLGLGGQSVRYRESSTLLPVKSEARTNSPMLMTGALYALDSQWLFSLDSDQTFYPSKSTETWTATSPTFNGVQLTSPVLQTNLATLSRSQIQLLAHYRLQEQWFAIGGPTFRSQAFKRYAFAGGPDLAVNPSPDQTVEESTGEVLLYLGVALESERVRAAPTHYGLRALIGVPVWRRLENTSQPNLSFDGTRGFDVSLEGRYSWAVLSDVHLGGWGKWSLIRRSAQTADSGAVQLPASRQDGLSYGLELLWKL